MKRSGWIIASCSLLLSACAQPASPPVQPPGPPTLTRQEARQWIGLQHELRPGQKTIYLVADDASFPAELHISSRAVKEAAGARTALDTVLDRMEARPIRIELDLDAQQDLAWSAVVESAHGSSFSVPLPAGVAGSWIVTRGVPVQARRGAVFVHRTCHRCPVYSPDLKDPFNRRVAGR